jgi:hypothetical protein
MELELILDGNRHLGQKSDHQSRCFQMFDGLVAVDGHVLLLVQIMNAKSIAIIAIPLHQKGARHKYLMHIIPSFFNFFNKITFFIVGFQFRWQNKIAFVKWRCSGVVLVVFCIVLVYKLAQKIRHNGNRLTGVSKSI